MPEYSCETCGKAFKQKGHYDTHLARKRPCKKVVAAVATAAAPGPVLKWVGGKTQILEQVLDKFPAEMENYWEPFLGGGSVLLGLLGRVAAGRIIVRGKVRASDVNLGLIGLYKNIQSNVDGLLVECKRLTDNLARCVTGGAVNRVATTLEEALTSPESYYYWVRAKFNAIPKGLRDSLEASAMFLFLNKTCFRGLYREGPRGFNVPYGNYKNPCVADEAHLRAVSAAIQGVEFACQPFQAALQGVAPGDFVYLDPPYAPETDGSFVSYTANGFGADEHEALFGLCRGFAAANVKMLMSNAEVKLVKDAFPAGGMFETAVISCRRAIHSKEPDARTNEVLIRNWIGA